MENWGLVVYREERLLVNPDFDTTSDFYGQTSIIAHEIAHMVRVTGFSQESIILVITIITDSSAHSLE